MSIQPTLIFIFYVQNQLEKVSALLGAQVVSTFSTAGIGAYVIVRKWYSVWLCSQRLFAS